MSEANVVTHHILEYLLLKGAMAWRNNTGAYKPDAKRFVQYGAKGSGDILALYRGRFLSIEVKVGKDKLRPSQQWWMQDVRAHGGIAFVAHSLEDVIHQIEAVDWSINPS